MSDLKLKEATIAQVTNIPGSLQYLSPIDQSDPDIVLAAIAQSVDSLAFASYKLPSNYEFLKLAVDINPKAFNFVTSDKHIKTDKDFILKALNSNDKDIIKKGCNWLESAENLKDDKDLIRLAIKHNGLLLGTIGKFFKNDKEVVLSAIDNNPYAVLYMDDSFYNDRELLLFTFEKFSNFSNNNSNINNILYAFLNISTELKNDKDFVMQLLKCYNLIFTVLPENLKSDRQLILEAVSSPVRFVCKDNYYPYKYILDTLPSELKNDKEIVLTAVKANAEALSFASNELKDDPEVALAASWKIEYNPAKYKKERIFKLSDYVSKRIKNIIGEDETENSLQNLIFYEVLNNKIEDKEETKKPKLKI